MWKRCNLIEAGEGTSLKVQCLQPSHITNWQLCVSYQKQTVAKRLDHANGKHRRSNKECSYSLKILWSSIALISYIDIMKLLASVLPR